MSYIVRIVGPAGLETYLAHGQEVCFEFQADRYDDADEADKAGYAYRAARPWELFIYDVFDPEDF